MEEYTINDLLKRWPKLDRVTIQRYFVDLKLAGRKKDNVWYATETDVREFEAVQTIASVSTWSSMMVSGDMVRLRHRDNKYISDVSQYDLINRLRVLRYWDGYIARLRARHDEIEQEISTERRMIVAQLIEINEAE